MSSETTPNTQIVQIGQYIQKTFPTLCRYPSEIPILAKRTGVNSLGSFTPYYETSLKLAATNGLALNSTQFEQHIPTRAAIVYTLAQNLELPQIEALRMQLTVLGAALNSEIILHNGNGNQNSLGSQLKEILRFKRTLEGKK